MTKITHDLDDYLDPTMMVGGRHMSLLRAVAARKLFVLNGRGEYEGVDLLTFWKGDEILTVLSSSGSEVNESGDITRQFRRE